MIRRASIEDLDGLINLSARFHKESRWRQYPYTRARWKNTLAFCQENHFLWVHEAAGEVDAFMAGLCAPMMFSDALNATELALYVAPEARTGRTAIVLINRFIEWATEKGAVECVAGSSAGINIEGVRRIYEHCEFKQSGDLMFRGL